MSLLVAERPVLSVARRLVVGYKGRKWSHHHHHHRMPPRQRAALLLLMASETMIA